MKHRLDFLAMTSTAMGMRSADESEEEIIVSLTTHGRRILTVYRSIESIFLQTVKANRVILYL